MLAHLLLAVIALAARDERSKVDLYLVEGGSPVAPGSDRDSGQQRAFLLEILQEGLAPALAAAGFDEAQELFAWISHVRSPRWWYRLASSIYRKNTGCEKKSLGVGI